MNTRNLRGLIAATAPTESGSGPRALIRIGGITLLERQVRILRKAGVSEALVVAAGRDEALQAEMDRLASLKMRLRLTWPGADGRLDLDGTFAANDNAPWLLLDGASLFDERLSNSFGESADEQVALLPESVAASGDAARGLKLELGGKSYIFNGVARLRAGRIGALKPEKGDAWLAELLKSVVSDSPDALVDTATLPTYHYDMRRDVPYLWLPISRPGDNPAAKRELLNHAQKSVLDWPAWYIHRPIEKWIVYHICEWSITPNQLTLINNIVAFAAAYAFAVGALVPAMAGALAVGILDGLDGKQARVKMMTSEFGRIEEVLDKIYENTWYWAMAYYLSNQGYGQMPYILFGILFFCNMADIYVGLVMKKRRNIQLDDAGDFERRFRVISGRRNTYIWTLIPFLLAGAYYPGYWMMTAYGVLTLSVRIWRLKVRLAQPVGD